MVSLLYIVSQGRIYHFSFVWLNIYICLLRHLIQVINYTDVGLSLILSNFHFIRCRILLKILETVSVWEDKETMLNCLFSHFSIDIYRRGKHNNIQISIISPSGSNWPHMINTEAKYHEVESHSIPVLGDMEIIHHLRKIRLAQYSERWFNFLFPPCLNYRYLVQSGIIWSLLDVNQREPI